MTLTAFDVQGYRSLRSVYLHLKRVNVVVGANGCGKSNLYKSLRLVAAAAEGSFGRRMAEEGGLDSLLWAGSHGKDPQRIIVKVKLDNGLRYEFSCGRPGPTESAFSGDPFFKEERISVMIEGKKALLLDRKAGAVHARDLSGKRTTYPNAVPSSESVLSELREPHLYPELSMLRSEFLSWRFYHKFRTDDLSPLRQEQCATRTMALNHDGSDLAAALMTINWVGDREALASSVDNAFPGAFLELAEINGKAGLGLRMPDFNRAFNARELSDGTLHYLCLLAALLSPRPSGLLAINEPESSVHPDLLEPLADLIALASRDSQIWVITHSFPLAKMIAQRCKVDLIQLEKIDGETSVKGQKLSPDDDD
ncbi:MAG: AAA family ATPase [Candidatus Obscuribacterales bacterium]|nr:AAA family ATPase [Candidatus Obscuribacterales bacterium]